jgi:hypothetical protein
MGTEGTVPYVEQWRRGWAQPSLLEEDEAQLELRVRTVRGDPRWHLSATIVRNDGSWVTCHVEADPAGPSAALVVARRMLREQFDTLLSLIPPF